MDWIAPYIFLVALPAALLLVIWAGRTSVQPISKTRRRAQTAVRCVLVFLVLLAISGPAVELYSEKRAVIFVIDHTHSLGESGVKKAYERAHRMVEKLPPETRVKFVSAGETPRVLETNPDPESVETTDLAPLNKHGEQTNLERAVALARGLFPANAARKIVLISDGVETEGDLSRVARETATSDTQIYTVPIRGTVRPDVRVARLRPSRRRMHEGARLELRADVKSSMDGSGRIRLFENGIEVASRDISVEQGSEKTIEFKRTPNDRNLYRYEVRLSDFDRDHLSKNNRAMTLVEVRGKPLVLYVEGEEDQARYLAGAMREEGITLELRPPEAIPETPQKLSGYDGVILSDVPAYDLTTESMSALTDYVEKLGGGLVMIGGKNAFGAGGYYRTPIEKVLPVKMIPPELVKTHSSAVAIVLDRSGSMSGQKVEICKSAAVATVDMLNEKDHAGLVAFNSSARWVAPMTSLSNKERLKSQISAISAGGGTNIRPGMTSAYDALKNVDAKVKHMIVLSDGQTNGQGYQSLAAKIHSDNMSISTVAVGSSADAPLLKSISQAGDGDFYQTMDPTNIPSIFTRDTMRHTGRLIREQSFTPRKVEQHPMLNGIPFSKGVPELLGFVRTDPRSTAQVPLVTSTGSPLLAHWRFGLGKVTAFTSGSKTKWAPLWLTQWSDGYSQFWSQVLRETIREPEGQLMDIRVDEEGSEANVTVDLLENPAEFKQNARVRTSVYFVPAQNLGQTMTKIQDDELKQTGPGRYHGTFTPEQKGVYLIRARSGSHMVSTGFVHSVSGESAIGDVDDDLLRQTADLTGGAVLSGADPELSEKEGQRLILQDLTPYILYLALLVFLIDLVLRRWNNVRGVFQRIQNAWNTWVGAS